jgi:DNA-binding transcriptional MerR regulator
MTNGKNLTEAGSISVLPFDHADLIRMRVNQAGLARMMGVSRQTVNQWVQKGTISTYPDGTIDPQRAYREYLANSDPTRMQHRVLKTIGTELDELKQINAGLAADLRDKEAALQAVLGQLAEQAEWLEEFCKLIEQFREDDDGWADTVQTAFDTAGGRAMAADTAEALAKLDSWISPLYQPALDDIA